MGDITRYQKSFMIFKQEDIGFGTAQEPSGYIKIEVRDNRGKIIVVAQNLREDHSKIKYKAYVLKFSERQVLPVLVGALPLTKNRAELKWEFNPDDVAKTGSSIDSFNIAAVLAEYKDRENKEIICPLVAYRDKKVAWRDRAKEFLYPINKTCLPHAGNTTTDTGDSTITAEVDKKAEINGVSEETFESLYNNIDTECGMEKLKINLNRHFEVNDPFGSKGGNYKWWKVNNPVHLDNILYQCNMKTPLLSNPAIILAHFKYRHLIIGIYTDRIRQREYIVLGMPAIYDVDEKPLGEMCRWAQIEGFEPVYGMFGYWLVYIDAKNGKILRVN